MALARKRNSDSYFRRMTLLKKLFWLYFLLLIFEGALRKWVVPQLSAPLLIVRDPVSIWIVWEAYRTNKWPHRWSSMISLLALVLMGLFMVQSTFGDNPLLAGLYGLRSYLLPFPVMLIMGENLDQEDLHKLGACTLWLLGPMTLLEVGQYLTGANSFLNRGAYEGGAQIGYVSGHVRASGTFSFAIGPEYFDVLAAAFIIYGLVREGFARKWMLWAGAFALMLSVPMMGSRTVVLQLAALIGCMGWGAMMGVSQFGKTLRVILPLIIVAWLVSFLPVFSDAMGNMNKRFAEASESEGGTVESSLIARTLEPAVNAVETAASSTNWMGIGIGQGAAAIQALVYGTHEFVAGEYEFSRELVEMGPIAGTVFALFKVLLAITLLGRAIARVRGGEPLALLFLPLVMSALFYGVPEQPTLQGFMVISAAFCIAAAKVPAEGTALPLALQRQQWLNQRRVQRVWSR